MTKHSLYWLFAVTGILAPILATQFIFREIRLNNQPAGPVVAAAEFLFSGILLPVWIAVLYKILNKYFNTAASFIAWLLLALSCVSVSARLDFLNWWETGGQQLGLRDAEARDVIELGLSLQFLFSLLFTFLILFNVRIKPKDNRPVARKDA